MTHYFPTRLAIGKAFCNRKAELKRLKYNIENVNPVLIMSPRRYGKTSLSLRAFEQLKWPFVHIDLYKAFDEDDIERIILNGIGALLGQLEKTPGKLIKLASDFFASLHIKVGIEKEGLKLDFSKRKKNVTETIQQSLERLHALAKKNQKKVILYLDEFQIVGQISENYAIEAVIREVAQKSEYVAFVFSGSDRHLMQQLFNDKKRPFYNLCDIIILNRISEADYRDYLQHASVEMWGKELSAQTIEKIFEYSEFHSYYLNKLCSILWQDNTPTPHNVTEAWDNYVAESKSSIERELSLLTMNQRKILTMIAKEKGVIEPFGKEFLSKLNISSSSAARAMTLLLNKDYIHLSDNIYKVLDPLIQSVLSH